MLFYHPQTKLQDCNVFTGACLSTWGRWVYLWPHVFSGGGVGMSRGWVFTLKGGYIQGGGYSPLPDIWDLGYGRQAGGMHPTRMLCCFFLNVFF